MSKQRSAPLQCLWCAGVLVASLFVAAPSVAESDGPCLLPEEEPAIEYPDACGTTRIHGDSAGSFRLFLGNDVTFSVDPFAGTGDYTITVPDDRFAGFVLQQEREDPTIQYLIAAWRYPAPLRGGTLPPQGGRNINLPLTGNRLPAGWYRLYLLTEPGVEAEVELRFGGSMGTRTVQPVTASTFKFSYLDINLPSPDGRYLYSVSDTGEIKRGEFPNTGNGIAVGVALITGDFPYASRGGMCLYAEPLQHSALSSNCEPSIYLGGESLSNGTAWAIAPMGIGGQIARHRYRFFPSVSPGTYTFAANAQSAGLNVQVLTAGIWISLD